MTEADKELTTIGSRDYCSLSGEVSSAVTRALYAFDIKFETSKYSNHWYNVHPHIALRLGEINSQIFPLCYDFKIMTCNFSLKPGIKYKVWPVRSAFKLSR